MKQRSTQFRIKLLTRFIAFTLLSGSLSARAENETLEFDSSFLMGPGGQPGRSQPLFQRQRDLPRRLRSERLRQ